MMEMLKTKILRFALEMDKIVILKIFLSYKMNYLWHYRNGIHLFSKMDEHAQMLIYAV